MCREPDDLPDTAPPGTEPGAAAAEGVSAGAPAGGRAGAVGTAGICGEAGTSGKAVGAAPTDGTPAAGACTPSDGSPAPGTSGQAGGSSASDGSGTVCASALAADPTSTASSTAGNSGKGGAAEPARSPAPVSAATADAHGRRVGEALRVLVVDDHPIWRDGVAEKLAAAGFTVVGTAGDGAATLRRARATRPDVVLLDLHLPGLSGAEVTRRLLAADPSVRVLVLSASGEHQDVLDAVTAGATGYLTKSAGLEEVIAAIRSAAAGEAVFTPGLAGLVLGEYRRLVAAPARADARTPRLTARETEVLRLVAKGLTYPQIAERLVLSPRTVQNHVQNTLTKLRLHNKAQLVRYALEQGLE